MGRSSLSELERRWLAHPPPALARVATVGPDGAPHVVPSGWSFDPTANEIVLSGRNVSTTVRATHVRATGRAAIVIDGITPGDHWSPWALIVRGRARVDDEANTIRIACDDVTSWGLATE